MVLRVAQKAPTKYRIKKYCYQTAPLTTTLLFKHNYCGFKEWFLCMLLKWPI